MPQESSPQVDRGGDGVLSNAELAAFFSQNPFLCVALEPDGRVRGANARALAAAGCEAGDVVGQPFWETPWWRKCPRSQRRLREAIPKVANGDRVRQILKYRDSGGRLRLLDLTLVRVDEAGGSSRFLSAVGEDVTDRVQTEDDLADAMRRMHVASEAANFGTFRFDLEERRFWSSPELRSLLGRDEDTPLSLDEAKEMVDPRDVGGLAAAVDECLRTRGERSFDGEFRLARPPGGGVDSRLRPPLMGHERWMLVRGRTVYGNGSGGVVAITGAVLDVTARHASERRLAEAQHLNVLALEAAGMGTWVADVPTGAIRRDATLNALLGLPAEQRDGTLNETLALVHPDDRDRLRGSLRGTIAGEGSLEIRFRVVRGDGEVRRVRVDGVPVSGKQRYGRWIGALTDITDETQSEERLQRAVDEAESANLAKSEFIANMSHEIRTPMTSIMGYADLLLQDEADEGRATYLQTIRRNGELLLALINDILDLSKIEAGRMEIDPVRVDLQQLLTDVRGMVLVRAEEKGLAFQEQYADGVPRFICTDAMRVRQVLINLLGNAVKFTRAGTVRLHVRVEQRRRLDPPEENLAKAEADQTRKKAADSDDPAEVEDCEESTDGNCEEDNVGEAPHVRFDVIDSGVGIDAEHQKRLFVPFAQADASVSRNFGGTGLGLAICQRLAAILGGLIEFESEADRGSRFSLIVPCDTAVEAPYLQNPEQTDGRDVAQSPATSDVVNARVMVVDDQPDIRFLTTVILEKAGVSVESVVDGIEALSRLTDAADPPDLLLLDMQMPRLSGYETAERLRAAGFDRPIIALTADAMHGDMDRCLASGCDAYLSKPIDAAQLVEIVARHTGR